MEVIGILFGAGVAFFAGILCKFDEKVAARYRESRLSAINTPISYFAMMFSSGLAGIVITHDVMITLSLIPPQALEKKYLITIPIILFLFFWNRRVARLARSLTKDNQAILPSADRAGKF